MRKTVYLFIENTPTGIYTKVFKTKQKSSLYVRKLLKEYSDFYRQNFKKPHELAEITNDEVFLDVFETVLE